MLLTSTFALAQEKGVDPQNERIRDNGTNRPPATNGGKLDTGAGRGIDFGRGRTEALPPVANPYRLTGRRDAIVEAIQEVMRERKLILDDAASKPAEGVLITQPYTFTKGAVVATSELNQLADVPETFGRGYTRGRYTLIIEVQPLDGTSANVSVNARIEGRTDGVAGPEWITLQSTGAAEQDFIVALVEKITGGPPAGRDQ